MDPEAAALRLEKLRSSRARRERDDSLNHAFLNAARDLDRLRKALPGVAEAWESVCPKDLLSRTAIRTIRRGTLTIGVADAPTRFELDRILKAGAQRDLVRRCPMTVRKVRLVNDAALAIEHDTPPPQ